MAQLKGTVEGNWYVLPNENFESYLKRQDKMLADLEAKGNIIKFPAADGYALYFVESMKPLVLKHIPYADGYQIDPAHIRGLRAKDVQDMIDREKRIKQLFKGR